MLTILTYAGLFVASVVITLGGCHLFTNGIEWLGKRLKVSEGAVGSVFAAVGTTLPETSIPIIAIFFGSGQERTEVGLGAILGARRLQAAGLAGPPFPDQAARRNPRTRPRANAPLACTSCRRPRRIAPPRSRPASQRFRAMRAAM